MSIWPQIWNTIKSHEAAGRLVPLGVFSKLVEKEDLTKREIAFRLGKEPSQITRWLSGPSNWTLDTFSDLLIAMGAELDHSVSMINEKAASTVRHPLMQTHVCEVIELKSPNASVGESHASTNMDFSYEVKAG